MSQAPSESGPGSSSPEQISNLGNQLGGDLPCVVCGYNLRGVTIRGVCPECGTAVRATILAVVDPRARELTPIGHPRLVAVALNTWIWSALLAALLCWIPHLGSLADLVGIPGLGARLHLQLGVPVASLVLLSAIAGSVLIRPHSGLPSGNIFLAFLGFALMFALAWTQWVIHGRIDPASPGGSTNYLSIWDPDPDRVCWRLLAGGLIALIALFVRPNARSLVARSLALRQGRVDRQTLAALAVAAAIAAVGDSIALWSLHLGGGLGGLVRHGAVALILVGSAFLTFGLAGAAIDCWRISRAVLAPSPTLRDLVHGTTAGSKNADDRRC